VSKNKIIINHPDQGHNGHIFYLIAASEAERSALRGYLRENGIFSEPHYSSLANSPYGRQFTSQNGTLVNSEDLCHRLLRLPIWYGISDSEVEMVASGIESFYAQ
jgi:dTDP-4-amino-4,6-dideoxygalactose transaminase